MVYFSYTSVNTFLRYILGYAGVRPSACRGLYDRGEVFLAFSLHIWYCILPGAFFIGKPLALNPGVWGRAPVYFLLVAASFVSFFCGQFL